MTKDTPDSDNDVTCAELKADEGYKSSVNSGTISRSCSRPMSICSEPERRWTDAVAGEHAAVGQTASGTDPFQVANFLVFLQYP